MPKGGKTNGLKSYHPVEGPTTRQLEWGLWWIENKDLLKNVLLGFLIFINVVFWGYSLFHLINYGASGLVADRELARAAVKQNLFNHAAIANTGARPLNLGRVAVLNSVDNSTYDLASEVSNSNSDWYATFDYFFTAGQNTTEAQKEFIMPKETKYLTHFLYEGPRPSSVRLEVTNLRWQRIDKRETGNIENFINNHNAIEISDINFTSGSFGAAPFNYVSFNARNNSAYNYWTIDLYLTAQSGSRLLGVNKYALEKFKSGDSRDVEILWPGNLRGGRISITPSINVFDENNYMSFDLGPGQIK